MELIYSAPDSTLHKIAHKFVTFPVGTEYIQSPEHKPNKAIKNQNSLQEQFAYNTRSK